MHAQEAGDDACAWTQDNLGAYIRNAASKRDSVKVRAHIDECRRCMGIYLELSEVDTNLSGILGPLVLGSAAAGYIAAALGTATQGGLLGFLERAGDVVGNHGSSFALAGVAATIVLITGLFVGLRGQPAEAPPVADAPVVVVTTPVAPLTFGNGGPTLSPVDTPAPSTGVPDNPSRGDPSTPAAPTTSAPTSSTSAPSATDGSEAPEEPRDEPDGEINTPPTSQPPTTPPPATPPQVDSAVRASSDDQGVTVKKVTLAISGLPGEGGTLYINTSDNRSVRLEGDCGGQGPVRTCPVPADMPQLHFTVVTEDIEQGTKVWFRLKPIGATETDEKDNVAELEFQPAP